MHRHSFDIFSFVAGLVFAGAGVAYLINDGRWRFDAGPWVWPAVLLVGGVIILLSTIRDGRGASPSTATAATAATATDGSEPTGVDEIDEIEAADPSS